ncbi:MAG: hypothetical protein ACT4PT_09855 [Methanobacteriota archaeon]
MIRSLLQRFLGKPQAASSKPLSVSERARLDHRRRQLEREIRRLEKANAHIGCSSCANVPPPKAGIEIERRIDRLRKEHRDIQAGLRRAGLRT